MNNLREEKKIMKKLCALICPLTLRVHIWRRNGKMGRLRVFIFVRETNNQNVLSGWKGNHFFLSFCARFHLQTEKRTRLYPNSETIAPIPPHSPQEKAKDRLANASKHRTYSHNIKTIVLLLIRQSTYISNGDIPLTYFTAI